MVGIIIIHTNPHVIFGIDSELLGDVYLNIVWIVSKVMCNICVPLFFFFSGYLFFNSKVFNWSIYFKKLKKRFLTLVIPLILWTALTILCVYLSQFVLPGNKAAAFLNNFAGIDWLRIFWDMGNGFPYCAQFWFLRDLIVMVVISPLIYKIINKSGCIAILVFGIIWVLNIWPTIPGLSITAIFFFMTGGWYRIHSRSFLKDIVRVNKVVCVLYPLLMIIIILLRDSYIKSLLVALSTLCGIIIILNFSRRLIEVRHCTIPNILGDSSFFLYASHGIILLFLKNILLKVLPHNMDGMQLIITYPFIDLSIILISLTSYLLLKHYTRNYSAIRIGSRTKTNKRHENL